MILLWTTSNKISSRLIRYGLDEPMSHFGVGFFATETKGIILHQTFTGFKIQWLPEFLKDNRIVHLMKPKDLGRTDEKNLLQAIMNEFAGTSYDGGSFAYFTWRAFLRKFFSEPFPEVGKWGSGKAPLCTGLAKVLRQEQPLWFSRGIKDFDIVTPGFLYHNMKNSGKFTNENLKP